MNSVAGRSRCSWASRLVRLETGSSSEAALASHTEAKANGNALMPSSAARASPIGASSTAVVSMLSTQVADRGEQRNSRNRPSRLPRAARAAMWALTSKSPASSHRSATIWISARNRQHRPDAVRHVRQARCHHATLTRVVVSTSLDHRWSSVTGGRAKSRPRSGRAQRVRATFPRTSPATSWRIASVTCSSG